MDTVLFAAQKTGKLSASTNFTLSLSNTILVGFHLSFFLEVALGMEIMSSPVRRCTTEIEIEREGDGYPLIS